MSRTGRLLVVLVANLGLVGALVGVGITAHSLGVFAEGADYLADAAAIAVSLLAIHLGRRPPTPRRPGGYPRATRYAALVNAGWLLLLSLLVVAGAGDRLARGAGEVAGLPVLTVSGAAALVMLAVPSCSAAMRTATAGTSEIPMSASMSVPCSSIPPRMPLRRPAWPSQAGSCTRRAAPTGSTLRWRSSSRSSSATTRSGCSGRSAPRCGAGRQRVGLHRSRTAEPAGGRLRARRRPGRRA